MLGYCSSPPPASIGCRPATCRGNCRLAPIRAEAPNRCRSTSTCVPTWLAEIFLVAAAISAHAPPCGCLALPACCTGLWLPLPGEMSELSGKGRQRGRRSVPTAKAERPLWVQSTGLRQSQQRREGCADSSHGGESDLAAGFDPSAVQRGRDPSQRAIAAAWAYAGLASITSMEPRVGITAVSSNPAVASRS
jgi:hypothetical protein